jgi:hypothetical protein
MMRSSDFRRVLVDQSRAVSARTGAIRPGSAGVILAAMLATLISGCGSPSAANIELRKQKQALEEQVDQLKSQHQRDADALAACRRSHPTTSVLTPDRLDQLVTAHGLSIGLLTGGDNPDSTQPFDSQLKIYAVPIDRDSTPIKVAGGFKIEAFDLDDPARPVVGNWSFDLQQTRGLFYNRFSLYTYVLTCPFPKIPLHSDLTIRVTFDDALTGAEFVEQTQVKIRASSARP